MSYTLPIVGRDFEHNRIEIDEDGCMSSSLREDPDGTPVAHLITREQYTNLRDAFHVQPKGSLTLANQDPMALTNLLIAVRNIVGPS